MKLICIRQYVKLAFVVSLKHKSTYIVQFSVLLELLAWGKKGQSD